MTVRITMFNSKEKLLIISILLVLLGLIYLFAFKSNCYPVEYQNLGETHTVQVCEGE